MDILGFVAANNAVVAAWTDRPSVPNIDLEVEESYLDLQTNQLAWV